MIEPPRRCHECDNVLDIDGDDGACNYTGGSCPPGGCDCGAAHTVLCDDCQPAEAHDWTTCGCADCSDERAIRTAEHNHPEARL